MFNSITGVFSKLKQTQLAQTVSSNYKKLKEHITANMTITQIIPNLYHISYPQKKTLKDLKMHIKNTDYQIWNIGQYKYAKQIEQQIIEHNENGQIHHLCFQYYSNLPLYELIIAINSIHYFMAINPQHKVYVHCQDNKLRSSVFFACFVYKFKINSICDVSQAILFVNQKLSTHLQVQCQGSSTAHYNNQHIFFKNFINYLNHPQIINPHKLQLLKIIISDAPKLKLDEQVIGNNMKQLKVGIQIRCKEQVVLKATYDSAVFEGDSLCIVLNNRTIILGDDFLVMIKYVYQGKVYGMMRIQLNTNFIFEKFIRTHQQQIDLSSFCLVQKKSTMFIDFLFQNNLSHSDLAQLQDVPEHSVIKIPKKQQIQAQKKELDTKQSQEIKVEVSAQNFSLNENDEEEHEVDETEINKKIEEVMKNINSKGADSDEEEEGKESEEDLDDYLSKLEENA